MDINLGTVLGLVIVALFAIRLRSMLGLEIRKILEAERNRPKKVKTYAGALNRKR